MSINKSLATNLISVALVGVGFAIPSSHFLAHPIREIGLYATSGAITNWIAIYMLFEKVPGLYGSGVIPSRFEEFKAGIHGLIMGQFFTRENVESFIDLQSSSSTLSIPAEPILEEVDYDAIFQRLVDAVLGSSFGGMLGIFGGPKALEPLRVPMQNNIQQEIRTLLDSPNFHQALVKATNMHGHAQEIIDKVDAIVRKRLDELTPQMVKEIIQTMIREHLGWLVVWGGVFGGLIGLVAAMLP